MRLILLCIHYTKFHFLILDSIMLMIEVFKMTLVVVSRCFGIIFLMFQRKKLKTMLNYCCLQHSLSCYFQKPHVKKKNIYGFEVMASTQFKNLMRQAMNFIHSCCAAQLSLLALDQMTSISKIYFSVLYFMKS